MLRALAAATVTCLGGGPGPHQPERRNAEIKTAMIRINPEGWRKLRRLAIDLNRPLDDFLIDAANEMLQRHGRPSLKSETGRRPDEKP